MKGKSTVRNNLVEQGQERSERRTSRERKPGDQADRKIIQLVLSDTSKRTGEERNGRIETVHVERSRKDTEGNSRTLYTYIQEGTLKASKSGKYWRVKHADLMDFVDNGNPAKK